MDNSFFLINLMAECRPTVIIWFCFNISEWDNYNSGPEFSKEFPGEVF
jgi:hypothetical protein